MSSDAAELIERTLHHQPGFALHCTVAPQHNMAHTQVTYRGVRCTSLDTCMRQKHQRDAEPMAGERTHKCNVGHIRFPSD